MRIHIYKNLLKYSHLINLEIRVLMLIKLKSIIF